MELLFNAAVNRILKQYVKNADGQSVKLTSDSLFTLHNIDLNLPFPEPFVCKRAFAKTLKVKVPWTALTTEPLQVGRPDPGMKWW
jgi:N-terminal region of Chorein or VPS13